MDSSLWLDEKIDKVEAVSTTWSGLLVSDGEPAQKIEIWESITALPRLAPAPVSIALIPIAPVSQFCCPHSLST